MANLQIKSEKLTPFGGIFSIMEQFDSTLSSVIDSTLGLRCRLFGYQYSEIIRSLMSIYFCGGSCIEDVTTHLMNHLSLHPTLRTCSSDTILRAIKELTQGNLSYTSDTSKNYDSNTTDTLTASLQVEQAVACTIVSLGWHIGVIEDARHHLCEFPEYLSGTLYVLAGAPPPPCARSSCLQGAPPRWCTCLWHGLLGALRPVPHPRRFLRASVSRPRGPFGRYAGRVRGICSSWWTP